MSEQLSPVECPSRDLLIELVQGRLSKIDRTILTEHFSTCSKCQSQWQELGGKSLTQASSGPRAFEERSLVVTRSFRDEDDEPGVADIHTGRGRSGVNQETASLELGGEIGRYSIQRSLGEGSYGHVYLAQDEELKRLVAIKVLRQRLRSPKQIDRFLHEARVAAALKHQHIVTVFDVVQEQGGCWCLIYAYIEGQSLRSLIRNRALSHQRSAELIAVVASALDYAHQRGIIHRDIKPDNILIDTFGQPYVTDFGLALNESLQGDSPGRVVGTPAYMAPEQVRGETHRTDCRTDVWALGVTLYEMLVERRPFDGLDRVTLYDEILSAEPKPLSQFDAAIPAELERICLKCLTKPMQGRYATAAELAADLNRWAQGGSVASKGPIEVDPPHPSSHLVVPKGLRAFDHRDAVGFLDLLPGPIEHDGLPTPIHFWKVAIEELDPAATFSVGVLYGPSGCGKTSLVRAGLLPHLSRHVMPVYIEASAERTETILLNRLQRLSPSLPTNLGLNDALVWLRETPTEAKRPKILIVLDQFEQWLHAHPAQDESELSQALRQCDGVHIQCLLMVRDDFGMALTRFMDRLEISLAQGKNFATVDLFSRAHALHVIQKFGQALGRLPADSDKITPEQWRFMVSVVNAIGKHDQVVPVRLSVFVDMFQNKPWTEESLKALGGPEGVDIAFLEEMFHARGGNPAHRRYSQAAEKVLQKLLPESGREFRGSARSAEELAAAVGLAPTSREMRELIRILAVDARLIMQVDQGSESDSLTDSSSSSEQVQYQLTHDFLVQPLRRWLIGKQRETLRGRLQLRIEEQATIWSIKPHRDRLPHWWEWAAAAALTAPAQRSRPAREMMESAKVYYARRLAILCLAAAIVSLASWQINANRLQSHNREHAKDLIELLLVAKTSEVPGIIDRLKPYQTWAEPELRAVGAIEGPTAQLHASLALLAVDRRQTDYVLSRLRSAQLDEVLVIAEIFKKSGSSPLEQLWRIAQGANTADGERLRAGCILAQLDGKSPQWPAAGPLVAKALIAEDWLNPGGWIEALEPAGPALVSPLVILVREAEQPQQRFVAASALANYAADDSELLVALLADAQKEAFPSLLAALERQPDQSVAGLKRVLEEKPQHKWPPIEQGFEQLPSTLVRRLEAADGMAADDFTICQRAGIGDFDGLCTSLEPYGYQLVCFRPYREKAGLVASAVWHKAADRRQHVFGLTADELRQEYARRTAAKLQILDLAAYEGANGATQYSAVWAPPSDERTETAMYCAIDEAGHGAAWDPLNKAGYIPRTNFITIDPTSHRPLYNSVRWKIPGERDYHDSWGSVDPERTFDSCRADLRFDLGAPEQLRYSSVWWDSSHYQSEEIVAPSAEQHLQGCKKLAELGYRPISISGAPDQSGAVVSVWHRPVVTAAEKDRTARRKANAAIALLALNDDTIWQLLDRSTEPNLRHRMIHAFAERNVDPTALTNRLQREQNPSIQFAVLGALSRYDKAFVSPSELEQIDYQASRLFQTNSNVAVHSMAEQVLEHFGGAVPPPVAAAKAAVENKTWLTSSEGHKLAIIRGPIEFMQGSPGDEPRRDQVMERRHPVHIPRSFAIATKEITIAQFLKFKPGHEYPESYASDRQCPATNVNWYDAVQYCRWLSEREGIPEAQMCYPPIDQIHQGLQIAEDWQSRTGYRLPTEAEWEYSCRSGVQAAHYFGDNLELLPLYGWTVASSGYRLHPVAELLPNDFGLFDMLGNAMEWCQDGYDTDTNSKIKDTVPIDDNQDHILRGGAFLFEPSAARAARRGRHRASVNQPYVGFRVARTVP